VIEFEDRWLQPGLSGNVPLTACSLCAALVKVIDQERHARWHEVDNPRIDESH
jgi:hypothetical protein